MVVLKTFGASMIAGRSSLPLQELRRAGRVLYGLTLRKEYGAILGGGFLGFPTALFGAFSGQRIKPELNVVALVSPLVPVLRAIIHE